MFENWLKHLNIGSKTIELLQENMEENLYDLVFDSGFLDDNDSTSNRRKKNKLNIIKTLKFCTSKMPQRQGKDNKSNTIYITTPEMKYWGINLGK